MKWWRQLRWRIVAANMLVVVVGVVLILLMAYWVTQAVIPAGVQESITTLTSADNPNASAEAADELLNAIRQTVFTSVVVAALGAIIAGLAVSLLLARQILRPLHQIADSSQRIADGRYDERVTVPGSDELALMATNFNQMAEALAQIEQTRVTLIGNVSHELRTPLTSMMGYLEGLMDGLFPGNEETYGVMYAEMNRMRRLVDDLQTLSRVESGQMSLELTTFELRPLIERVVAQLQPQATSSQLALVWQVGGGEETAVYADSDRAAQVLVNLIGNAIRYTLEGGHITVQAVQEPHAVRVCVMDDGVGIPEDALPYLFERFYRVDQSRTRSSGGSGIGLTISRYLVWAMGGEMTAISDGIGNGSTFTFTLPRAHK